MENLQNRVQIGKTGLQTFKIGFGAGVVGNSMMYPKMDDITSKQLIQTALAEGIELIDTAFLYGMGRSEELIGEVLSTFEGREKVIISTKASANPHFVDGIIRVDNSPEALRQSVEDSLRRLQIDYIDIFYLHYPNSDTTLDQAAETLSQLKEEGKIKAIGASNLSYRQVQEFNVSGHLDILQTEYSLLVRQPEEEIIPYCLEHEISVVPFFPLASGLLAGAYNKDDVFTDMSRLNNPMFQGEAFQNNLLKVDKLKKFALQKGVHPAQIALAWLLTRPAVDMIIPGATRPDQIKSNLESLTVSFTVEELAELDSMFPRVITKK